MGLWQGLKWYYELCGTRGVCAIASFRLFGRPPELSIVPPESEYPVYLRIDTSDFCAYRDVLIFRTKSYDPEVPDFCPTTIVDVGAHIGMASILFAHKYPSARIIAIEPEYSNFAALTRNTATYKNITPIHAALWREDGQVTLGPSKAHPKGAFRIDDNGQQSARAITMDTVMRETGIVSIDLLKVDIEGAEIEVFECCPWIRKVQITAIELHDRVRSGCSAAVRNAAGDFHWHQRGEITFLARQPIRADAAEPTGRSAPEPLPAA
jgi:FkbM family methyltransferase